MHLIPAVHPPSQQRKPLTRSAQRRMDRRTVSVLPSIQPWTTRHYLILLFYHLSLYGYLDSDHPPLHHPFLRLYSLAHLLRPRQHPLLYCPHQLASPHLLHPRQHPLLYHPHQSASPRLLLALYHHHLPLSVQAQ
jgi:hypothetical protein